VTRAVLYDEVTDPAQAEAVAAPLDRMLPAVPGALDVGHPQACEALIQAAAAAGATMVRGVGDVEVAPGDAPVVRYEHDDLPTSDAAGWWSARTGGCLRSAASSASSCTRPRRAYWVVGCSSRACTLGRHSSTRSVLRVICSTLSFRGRTGGRVLYLLHDIAQKGRFAGPDRQAKFLAAFEFRCIPGSEMFGTALPAGPCAFYPMNDSWVDQPYAPGVVLIGDAARVERPGARWSPADTAAGPRQRACGVVRPVHCRPNPRAHIADRSP
jgi:hypothetical protein